MSEKPVAYKFTLLFPDNVNPEQVSQLDFQVTGEPPLDPPLPQNQMPASFAVNDTLEFTYKKANKGVKVKSCILTQYNVDTSTKETWEDFRNEFDKPITITKDFIGSWVFHLLGLYKSKDKDAAFYLDPEFTCSN